MFQLWCSVNWGLRPQSFPSCFCSHVPSCSSPRQFVSHTMCSTFLPWFLTPICDSGFKVWSEASGMCSTFTLFLTSQASIALGVLKFLQLCLKFAAFSAARCQLQFSTSTSPRWYQGCVQSPVPALAHCRSHVPAMALEPIWVSSLDFSCHSEVVIEDSHVWRLQFAVCMDSSRLPSSMAVLDFPSNWGSSFSPSRVASNLPSLSACLRHLMSHFTVRSLRFPVGSNSSSSLGLGTRVLPIVPLRKLCSPCCRPPL